MNAMCDDPTCGFQDVPHYRGTKLHSCAGGGDSHDEVWYEDRNCPLCMALKNARYEYDIIETERDRLDTRVFELIEEIRDLKHNGYENQRTIIEDGM